MRWELEEIARKALETADLPVPIDPDRLAFRLGLEVKHYPGCEGLLIGTTIIADDNARMQRRAFAITHEIGHHLLRHDEDANTEAAANYLGSALLLPRLEFEADLRRCGWDLIALCARHRWASFEAVARRICALRDARAFVFDKPLSGQRAPSFYSVPWGLSPSSDERVAAREAVKSGAPVEIRTGVTAWPVLQSDWHRVITVTACE